MPQLLYLPGVHFNHADGAGDRFILESSSAVSFGQSLNSKLLKRTPS